MPERLDPAVYRDIVRRAIAEDVGPGDVTTWGVVAATVRGRSTLFSKCTCVLAGLDVAREVFEQVDASLQFTSIRVDGDLCRSGDPLARVDGRAASILTAERTALNFLQHLSGIATMTRRFVDATGGALAGGVDAIMLDNMDDATMREAIRRIAGRARVEISGGVTLERIRLAAMMGADSVSVGALTQSAPAVDISLDIETE